MNEVVINEQNIQNKIYTIRGIQVMLDEDLAKLYQVESKRLNEQVKRNIKRFPDSFRFQLTQDEYDYIKALRSHNVTFENDKNLRSQFATSKQKGGRRYLPYVFTEQGVSMLSAVLKSDIAIEISIKIIESFVSMRKIITSNSLMFERFERIENKLSLHDKNFDEIFKALEVKPKIPNQKIFYDGEVFDAYVFVADIIKSAKSSIVLIDNFVDETVLMLLSKRASKCKATIYTKTISKQLQLDLKKHNEQYLHVEIKKFNASHDRFLIIDEKEVYHIGASLKDLGKKWFGFSKMDSESLSVLGRLK